MVSAMKMRKAQERVTRSRSYRKDLHEVLASFQESTLVLPERLTQAGNGEAVLVVTFASDRGLCGPFNNNVITALNHYIDSVQPLNVEVRAIGWKVGSTLVRRGYRVIGNARRPSEPDRPRYLRLLAQELMKLWQSGKYQRISLLYASLRGMSVQKPVIMPWLPLEAPGLDSHRRGRSALLIDFIDEPGAQQVYEATLQRYLDNTLVSALLESEASEHVARMVAMDNATRNAEDLFSNLQLTYNKARQAKITQEICEIVSGANAIGKG
jgi:F-type H+-transporting ATPase subunit gamma